MEYNENLPIQSNIFIAVVRLQHVLHKLCSHFFPCTQEENMDYYFSITLDIEIREIIKVQIFSFGRLV